MRKSFLWKCLTGIGLAAIAAFGCSEGALAAPPNAKKWVQPYELTNTAAPRMAIDRLVKAKLDRYNIQPAALCSDEVFVRRAHLDLTGMIPRASDVRAFMADKRKDKRDRLINKLLDSDAYADYWALKWCDVLRVKAEFPINLWPNGVQAYYRWVHHAMTTNMRYDEFARLMLTSSGSNFREPPVNFYRAMQGKDAHAIARSVGLTFMCTRVEEWDQAEQKNIDAFFSRVKFKGTAEWKEEIVMNDPAAIGDLLARFPGGRQVDIPEGDDPRAVFADWLITKDNPWFARAIANRIWAWVFGKGIVEEVDDMGPHNPPNNPELLDHLADELVKSGWDIKQLIRTICRSRTYQQSSILRSEHEHAEKLFAAYPVRRLDAEVLSDVLVYLFGGRERYMSMVPEPFTFVPPSNHSVMIEDGSITSQFLEMFGKPSRDTGLMNERSNKPTPSQKLHLLNSSSVQDRISKSTRLKAIVKIAGQKPGPIAEMVYINLLSRKPTAKEKQIAIKYIGNNRKQFFQGAVDLTWALVNTKEFLYRH